jgi:hypothetical protein
VIALKKVVTLKRVKPTTSNSKPQTVAEMKRKYSQLPLHFLFGIEKEIDFQCESIDQYIFKIEESKDFLKKIRKCKTLESAQIQAVNCLHSMDKVDANLDIITRCKFEELRSYAEAWKKLAIAAINETKNPEKFLKI